MMMGTMVQMIDASMGDVRWMPSRNGPWLSMMPNAAAMMTHLMSFRSILSFLMNSDAVQKAIVPNRMRNVRSAYGLTARVSKSSLVDVKFSAKSVATVAIVTLPIIFGDILFIVV